MLFLLQLGCVCLFLGRGWQHLVWDAPYRALFWDENLLKGLVEGLTPFTWTQYVTHPKVDYAIQILIKATGLFYLCCAFASFFIKKCPKKVSAFFLIGGAVSLAFLSFLYCKEKFFHLGQFFEYASQVLIPVFLYLSFNSAPTKRLVFFINVAISLTFFSHGLYAMGFYPVPGSYIDMLLRVFPLQETQARTFIKIIGHIDLVMAVCVFIPKVSTPFLIYGVVWGFLTAFARLFGNFYLPLFWDILNQWLPEVLYRIPHGVLPLFLILKKYRGI